MVKWNKILEIPSYSWSEALSACIMGRSGGLWGSSYLPTGMG